MNELIGDEDQMITSEDVGKVVTVEMSNGQTYRGMVSYLEPKSRFPKAELRLSPGHQRVMVALGQIVSVDQDG